MNGVLGHPPTMMDSLVKYGLVFLYVTLTASATY
jgi:hypothetical protein